MATRSKSSKPNPKLDQFETEAETPNSVILLSSDDNDDDEANKDLTDEIVERAKRREANKRKRQEGEGSEVVVDVSSDEVVEVEENGVGGGDGAGEVEDRGVVEVKTKRKRKNRRSQKDRRAYRDALKRAAATDAAVDNVGVEETVEIVTPVQVDAIGSVKKEDLVDPVQGVETNGNSVDVSDNTVLRKLLRKPRYFDAPNQRFSTCYNCGEEGHLAVDCLSKKRKKPCFICGSLEHGRSNCTQGQECFICKKSDHRAKDCPDKNIVVSQNSINCLKCGGSGHTMVSCMNDYALEDLKEIQCYICNEFGHLCCVNSIDFGPGDISCYNCGESGHIGVGCAKKRGVDADTNSLCCYKCGEEGHFARGCTNNSKSDNRGEFSTPAKRFPSEPREFFASRSAPGNLDKVHKKNSTRNMRGKFATAEKPRRFTGHESDLESLEKPKRNFGKNFESPKKSSYHHDRRDSVSTEKYRGRGGWTPDDAEYQQSWSSPSTSSNGWRPPIGNNAYGRSPVTPSIRDHRFPMVNHGINFPNFQIPLRQPYPPPSTSHSYASTREYPRRFSASRFGNPNSIGEFNNHW